MKVNRTSKLIYIYMFALLSVIIERFALHGKITGKFALQG